ncbi:MAG: hypothetical protein R3B57_10720 [Phycisphaerales bacterium]
MNSVKRSLRQSTALYAIGVGTPVLAVIVARFGGPASTLGATIAAPQPAVVLPVLKSERAPADAAHVRALDRANALEESGVSDSPFRDAGFTPWSLDADSDTPEDVPVSPASPATRRIEPPSLEISAILSLRFGPLAVIDGRIRREGDLVAPDWILLSIDASHRRLVLRHVSGLRSEVTLATP